jgi:hypothetical protein
VRARPIGAGAGNNMEDDKSIILLKGRLNGDQRNRLAKLLNMYYTPCELAKEIGFTTRQVYRVYIPAGLPHQRDEKKHIWINGKVFRAWVKEVYQKQELGINEAFCLTCKKAVKMVKPERIQEGRLFYYLCTCPNCGRKLARIITRGKRIE